MNIEFGKQIVPADLNGEHIDLFLLAGNHEKRVFTAFNFVDQHNHISSAVMLCYDEKRRRVPNKSIVKCRVYSYSDIYGVIGRLFATSKERLVIFVDYSCMTKPWYYAVILYLSGIKSDKSVKVYFSYTPSIYSPPMIPKDNAEICPLPGRYIVPTDKPKALIVCLGYEQNKAEGIINHLDPKLYYLFYTDPAADSKFVDTLRRNNSDILENTKNVITYRFDDLLFLERELTSLYHMLRDEYSIIIAPIGPKTFTFISMIMSVKYNDIDIWRVSSGSDINFYDRAPMDAEQLVISEVNWIGDR